MFDTITAGFSLATYIPDFQTFQEGITIKWVLQLQ